VFSYIVRRIASAVPVVFIVAVIAFMLIRLAAGDPAQVFLGPGATEAEIEQVARQLGLDRPLVVQFSIWLSNLVRGDLGQSIFLGRDVTTAIIERFPATLQLTISGFLFAIAIGIPLGVVAAVKHNAWADRGIMVFTLVGVSMPVFWLGLLLIWFFAVQLRWFPTGGYVPFLEDPAASLRYIVLPGISLGMLHAALITRITRASMLEVLRQDFIRTARAKGLRERLIVYGHALRNALIPTITVIGTSLGALLSGVVIIETVFTYPGVGRLVVQAVQQRDYNVVQGALLVVAGLYVAVNLLVDIAYSLVDPRIRYQ
jgi:peptide/nickel transport system permease protein